MKKRYRTLITLIALLATITTWGNTHYYFQNVTDDYNLSNMGFTSICEDDNGFVWCGGFNGLYYHNTASIEKVKLFDTKDDNPRSAHINSIYKDLQNTIWICTNKGLVKHLRSSATFEHKDIHFPDSVANNNEGINDIIQLDNDHYLIHKQKSAWLYDAKNNVIKESPSFIKKGVNYIKRDKNGTIYIAKHDGKIYQLNTDLSQHKLLYDSPHGGISCLCRDGNKFYLGYKKIGVEIINSNGALIGQINRQQKAHRQLKNNFVSQLIRRENGEIWIGTNEGIHVLKDGQLTLLDSEQETGLPHRKIYCLHQGLDEKIWVSTYAGSVAFYSKHNYLFKHILLDYPQKDLDKRHVSTICEDDRGFVWIGSEDEGGIKVYNPTERQFVNTPVAERAHLTKDVKTIVNIGNDCIAYGKSGSNKIAVYNYRSGKAEKDIELPIKPHPGVRGAHCINDILWVNNRNTIVAYDLKDEKVKMVINSPSRIWQMYWDSSHNLWVGTAKGLYILRPGITKLELCQGQSSSNLLSQASIYSVCEGRDGTIWVGTTGQGLHLYQPETQSITPAPNHYLTANADIYNLIVDQHNDIWYITNKGLYHYNTTQEKTDYYGTNGSTLNAENRLNASYLSMTGKLYIGAKNGFTIVDPSSIIKNATPPSVFLAHLKINNQPYKTAQNEEQRTFGLSQLHHITLQANENNLSLRVVSNNFIKSERNQYKYRLLNYDDEWITTPQHQDIIFTKVPPGHYLFEAYGSNNDDVWSTKPYRLEIDILYPIYQRWYALVGYAMLLLAMSWWIYKQINTKLKLRQEIEEARNASKVNEIIHTERIKLFTNISHELRTPLSLIVSPISHILKKDHTDHDTKHLLQVANRNAKRLQKIADQTIDFRLLEVDKLKPSFEKHDIIALSKEVFLCFEQQFVDSQIENAFYSEFKTLELTCDGDLIEKIIYNLVSNALKHTNEGDHISVEIRQQEMAGKDYDHKVFTGEVFEGAALSITVKDSGEGIKAGLLPHIFKRFAKGEQSHQNSTGIGLHLCSEYTKMNKGNLHITTQEGKGTSFTLNLPLKDETKYEKSELQTLVKFDSTNQEETLHVEENQSSNKSTIMVVEDNSELRDLLKTLLSHYYKVITAKCGEQAMTQLENLTPDLILTDVAMPSMSGIELCKQLKEAPEHKHIHIIVMTAFADRNYQMESILSGADAFFTKPIDESMLLAQIGNTLSKQLQADINTDDNTPQLIENSFIAKARSIVEKHLQNTDFQIADLVDELNVSKTTLTRRLKAEVQQNASGFIRDVRLDNAQKLLANNEFNIDEIAAFVGFSYTSYFITSFKNKYGITPSEFRKKTF